MKLKIAAVGDVSLNGQYLDERFHHSIPWRKLMHRFDSVDIRIANLESPITNAPRFAESKLVLRAGETAKTILDNSRFDLLGLANNHAMDFGPEGIQDTINELNQLEIPHVGAGANLTEARKPYISKVCGMSVAFVSYCDVHQISPLYAALNMPGVAPLDETAFEIVRRISRKVDWVIVQLHWGSELSTLPSPSQRQIACRFVSCGASLIVGHHPHVIQPMETIENVPVWYSLGNFTFSPQFWRGVNLNGEQFCGEFRIPPLARIGGIAVTTLRHGLPPVCEFFNTRIKGNGDVVELGSRKEKELWSRFSARLYSSSYKELWEKEEELAESRRKKQEDHKSLFRRFRLKAYQVGLLK